MNPFDTDDRTYQRTATWRFPHSTRSRRSDPSIWRDPFALLLIFLGAVAVAMLVVLIINVVREATGTQPAPAHDEYQIELEDGRTVTCITLNGSYDHLSCDWAGAR